MERIFRSEAMQLINSGRPFDLEIVTADRRRGTGGDLIALKGWKKLTKDLPAEARPGYTKKHKPLRDRKNDEHKTFQVFNPANRTAHPITVHFRLMQFINGKKIMNG